MEKWQNTRILSSGIEAEREAKKGDPVLQSYYLGLLAKEEGNQAKAVWWMNRTLNLKSQHFPAWLHLRDLLKDRLHLHKGLQGFLDFWPQFSGDENLPQTPTPEPD